VAEILARLEADPVELREQVLAEALLAHIDKPLEEMLRRGLVFELPVPREALAVVCESIPNLDRQINRAVALGLLEVSPDKSLRVPRILPLKLLEHGEILHRRAAAVLYHLWWQPEKRSTEERCLEIHRLALRGKLEKIAIEIAKALTTQWLYTGRFRESIKTCQDTLKVVEDFSLLYRLASAEKQMGEVDNALEHYQKALNSCPLEDEKEKALIIHNLAVLKAFQGEQEEAITLFQLSLVLKERIGDFGSMPATLNGMAVLKANQGRIEEAVTLYQQSLALNESKDIADIQGKVATLQNLATLEADRGHIEEAITLFQQSLAITERSGDVKTKAAILHNLAVLKANQGELEESIALYQKSLVLKQQIGDVQGKAATLQCLANLIAEQGQIEEAITLCQESLILQEKIGDIEGKAVTLHELGRLKAQQGQIEEATALFNQSLDINERINNVYRKAMTLQWLGGLAAYAEEDFYTAVDYFQQSLEILQRLQSPEAENAKQMLTRLRQELVSIKANSRQIEEAQKVKNIIAQMPPRKNALHKPEKLKKGKRKEWLRLNSDAKEKDSN
jgi:tetratricopeptide (TPR) repeat protein